VRYPSRRLITDVAVVGAGPAGLSAALYSARFCRRTLVVHDGAPRAARIPRTHNVPGFEDGVVGADLVARMARHASKFGACLEPARIRGIAHRENAFELAAEDGRIWFARSVILATGLELNQIPIDPRLHEVALQNGVLRYCPVCDGYEYRGKRVAVIGCDISGAAEALFLRQYSPDVTLLPWRNADLTPQERDDLAREGIATIPEPIQRYEPMQSEMRLHLQGRTNPLAFDVVFPALGTRPRNALATTLGLAVNESGKVPAGAPLGTSVAGLYCAGDLVEGLDQVSTAMGEGAIAATRAHACLREQDGKTVDAILRED
jgi:thioredoxin reductase (NADPH)